MTKAEWARREDLRIRLSQMLNESPLKEALEVCTSIDVDIVQAMPAGGVDLLQWSALNGREREGYHRFARNLKALAADPVERKPEPQPWVHKQPLPK